MHIYADPKRSPLVALFDAIKESSMIENRQVAVNPKVANAAKRAVNSQLSSRERQIANKVLESQSGKVAEAQEQVEAYLQGPLQEKFETLLQLVDANINPKSDLSLQRYLEKVTAVKQRLIQISGSSDAGGSARAAVQNVLGGTNNEFTDALQYSRLLEAGIGDQFLPFARNVFVQPFNITWDSIAGTAQRNINGMWAQSVVMPMESDLGGRYPFTNSELEVSIPMLAKYLDVGRGQLDQFIQTQLGGVVIKQGNQWVTSPGNELKVSPVFLNQINRLSAVSNDFFVNTEGGYNFELKPASTQGIVRFNISIDGQPLEYFNQQAEWKPFKWPGDITHSGVRISWETEDANVQKSQELNGRFAFIRLLEKARVTPVDRGTYLVESPVNEGKTLRFYMRTNAGKGPLGLLDLRNIKIPSKIFEVSK